MRTEIQGQVLEAGTHSVAVQAALYVLTLFLLVLCLMPPLGVLSGNEEDYFGLAAHAFAGDAPGYTALFDASRHRLLTDLSLGALINAVGFENAEIITRSLAALAYALLLRALFRAFGLALADAALIVIVFALMGQTLMGGEYLFGTFEAKVVAYLLVLAGLVQAASRRSMGGPVALFAVATYFHFLVGGFWFLAALAGRLFQESKNPRVPVRAALLYFLLTAPLLAAIAWTRLADARAFVQPPDLPTPDVIYSILRAPWHASPFVSADSFIAQWLRGYVLAAFMLAFCLGVAWVRATRRWRPTALWLASLLAYLFLALLAAYATRETGVLGKFYLFRPASLILLLWLAFAAACLASLATRRWPALRSVALVTLVPVFLVWTAQRVAAGLDSAGVAVEKRTLAEVLARQAAPGAVVLVDEQIEPLFLDFERRTGHPTLVMFKFMPTNDPEIIEWYRRITFRRRAFTQGCPLAPDYPVDFLLATQDRSALLTRGCGEPVYASERVALWRVVR